VDITLLNVPIAWGTKAPGTENNLANANAGNPATVTVESTTNVNVDIYIKGTNWENTTYGKTLGVDNCKYDIDDNLLNGGYATLTTTYSTKFFDSEAPGTSKNTYWFISIPSGQWACYYTNTISFKAVKEDTPP